MNDHKLNELIATNLMGWFKVKKIRINGRDLGPGWWREDYGNPLDPTPGACAMGLPSYSTDIKDAFEVVQAMRERRFEFALRSASTMGDLWAAAFLKFGEMNNLGSQERGVARTICLATARALNLEIPE